MKNEHKITQADVVAWLLVQREEIGVRDAQIMVWTSELDGGVRFMVHSPEFRGDSCSTLTASVDALRANTKSPAIVAYEKRAAAAKLIEEAELLDAGLAVYTP